MVRLTLMLHINLANKLTLLRLAALPVLVGLLFIDRNWAAWTCLILYIAAALTDWLDGWVARKYHMVSGLGTFLDPISDKIFVSTMFLTLIATGRLAGFGALLVILILTREFVVSGLREYLGPLGVKVPVTKLAKWKTTVQMIAAGALIVSPFVPYGYAIGIVLLLAATALTLVTGWDYLRTGLPHLRD